MHWLSEWFLAGMARTKARDIRAEALFVAQEPRLSAACHSPGPKASRRA